MKREFADSALPSDTPTVLGLTSLEQRAVETAMRSSYRLSHPAYSRDDMRQEASIAVLLARVRLSAEFTEKETEAYYARRALGGIIDGLREVLRQDGILRASSRASAPGQRYTQRVIIPNEPEGSELHAPAEPADYDSPDGNVAVNQAMQAIARMPRPFPVLALLSISGSSMDHIAKIIGVHPSRVSRLRTELAAKLRKFI